MDKIDVPFWEKVHQEYINGVKIEMLKSTYSFSYATMYNYFDKLGLPTREKKPKKIKGINKALLKGLWDKGQSKCRHCKQVKSIDLFTPSYSKLKDGTRVTRHYECKECRKEAERHKTDYYTKDRPKTALELGYKQCPKCGETKDASSYSLRKSGKSGKQLASQCNQCRALASRACNMPAHVLEKKRINDRRISIAKGNQSSHRSRAKKGGGEYGIVDAQLVFEGDNWTCYLCGVKVERAKRYKPNRATIDHVIPLSKGGSHTYDNVKTCCNWCNCSKHDKT